MSVNGRRIVASPDSSVSSKLVSLAEYWTASQYSVEQLAPLSPLLGYSTDDLASATQSGDWDEVVWQFGNAVGGNAVFAGLMVAREGSPEAPGMFVSVRDERATEVAKKVSSQLDVIGQHIFGYPCELHGRVVEFADVQLASGPLAEADEAPIALFTPFYLGGWRDRRRQLQARRTILFSNAVAGRFRLIAGRVAARGVTIDGAAPQILSVTDSQLRGAVAAWLTLHETMHGSGPAPFFAPWTEKATSSTYGVVEETRVDMTAFIALAALEGEVEVDIARELIILERLCRSARRGSLRRAEGAEPNLDDEHGMVWADALIRADAITMSRNGFDIDSVGALEAARRVLAGVYADEQRAAESNDSGSVLEQTVPGFRERHLGAGPAPNPLLELLLSLGAGVPRAVGLGAAVLASG